VRISGPAVREVLRPDADGMVSGAAFQLAVARGAGGEVDRLVAVGAGSGHAVGMCQWGAIGRARAGQDYRKILSTYFPGTKIEKAYCDEKMEGWNDCKSDRVVAFPHS